METLKSPKETKARKNHLCDWCNMDIAEGAIYFNSTHVSDGEIYNWKSHKHCLELVKEMNMIGSYEGITSDDFYQYVQDKYSELDTKENDTVEALDRVLEHYSISK